VGEGYGPMIVSNRKLAPERSGQALKSPFRARLPQLIWHSKSYNPAAEIRNGYRIPIDRIIPEILAGKFDAGLIIHEGQLTYASSGLFRGARPRRLVARSHRIGAASGRQRNSPLARAPRCTISSPRRCATRSSTASTTASRRWNTQCSLPATSIPRKASHFVSMYVNERTLDYGRRWARGNSQAARQWDSSVASSLIAPHVDFVD
jgi:1,4-dihydroxy-6-naphthoate synthase